MFNAERACTDTQVHYFYPQLTSISIVVRNLEPGWLEYLRGVDDKPPLGPTGKMPMRNQTPATAGFVLDATMG
jgi:hypothetical protein